MKASEITPGQAYLVGLGISRRYTAEGKAIVERVATEADKQKHRDDLRGTRLAKGSGHKLWLIRWVSQRSEMTYRPIVPGKTTVVPSSWFRQEWTDELDQEKLRVAAYEAVADDLTKRLEKALEGVTVCDALWRNEDDPVFNVRGQATEHPSFVFTKSAIEALLAQIEKN